MQENCLKEKRSKIWFWILIVLALAGLIWGGYVSDFSGPSSIVHHQLEMIKTKHFTQAYYDYTSKTFQQKYSLSDFKNFLITQPSFVHIAEISAETKTESDQNAKISITLISDSLEESRVDYSLVKEDNTWKIDEIELWEDSKDHLSSLLEEEEEEDAKPFVFLENSLPSYVFERTALTKEKTISPEIKSITVGDEVDQIGLIKKPRKVIDSDINLLFFNVRIEHGQAGALVSLFVKHSDSGAMAAPLSTTLRQDGLTVATFSYAAPNEGWPIGDYTVKVTLGTGQEKTASFQIRKGEREFY